MAKKVLLVDDQPNFVKMLNVKLGKMGYDVHTAYNGEEGVNVAREAKPDLIVMDIMMPVLDGFSAVEQIRSNPDTKDSKVIFLSARGQDEDKKRAEDLGAVAFFAKPFSPRLVVEKIEELLSP